jgi:N4-gp56 family major capsid protein
MNTTKTQINNINSFYSRDLLIRVQPLLVHNKFGMIKDIPKNNSDVIKFRRYANLSAATTPLVEGVTPAGSQLSKTDVTATLNWYGDYIVLTDKLTMETEDPVRMETNEILADQAADTVDQIVRDILVAGTSVIYSGSGNTQNSEVAAGDVITATNVDVAEETLKANKARFMTSYVDPSTGISTVPLPPCFIGICHVYTTKTIRAFTGFTKVELYAMPGARMEGEIGKYGNTRFIETVNAKVFTGAGTGSIDLYATLILAKYAYGVTRMSGAAMQNIVKPLGSGGSSDPLDQRETSGWKASLTACILNDAFMVRIVHARV